jgi:hypothetical protein
MVMMNGMVYYQMLLTVQLQTYCILLVHKFQQSQYKELQKVVKFIKLKFIKMSNKLDPKDLAYVQNSIVEERKLHQRVIDLAYRKHQLKVDEAEIEAEISKNLQKRQEVNQFIADRYGSITELNIDTGEFISLNGTKTIEKDATVEDIKEEA